MRSRNVDSRTEVQLHMAVYMTVRDGDKWSTAFLPPRGRRYK